MFNFRSQPLSGSGQNEGREKSLSGGTFDLIGSPIILSRLHSILLTFPKATSDISFRQLESLLITVPTDMKVVTCSSLSVNYSIDCHIISV